MIRANQIVYNVSNRSVFDIATTSFTPAGLASGIPDVIVPDIQQRGSGPPDMDSFNSGIGIAGVPRCFVNPVLGLNRILRPEPLATEYGLSPVSALRGEPIPAPAMAPRFIR